MARYRCLLVCGFLAGAGVVGAEPAEQKEKDEPSPIVKNAAAPLPAGARLQLGKLAGYRYIGRPATAALSTDGTLLAVADARDTITVVNTQTGKTVQTLKGNIFAAPSSGLAFSGDNSTLAIQTLIDMTVWDVASGKQLHKVQNRDDVGTRQQGPSMSSDGKLIGAAIARFANNQQTGEVHAIDLANKNKTIGPFTSIHNYNMRTAVAPDGKSMISWGQNLNPVVENHDAGKIQVWDLVKGKERHRFDLGHFVTAAAYHPNSKSIAALDAAGKFHLLDLIENKEICSFQAERAFGNGTVRYSPDGRQLVAYDNNGGLQAWTVPDGKRIALVNAPKTQTVGVAFPAKDRIVAVGLLGQMLCWWDANDEKATRFEGHLTPISALMFTPDGKSLISGGADLRLIIWWDPLTGQVQRKLTDIDDKRLAGFPGNRANALAFSPDGKHVAAYSYLGTRGVQMFDLADGSLVRTFKMTRTTTHAAIDFAPDGSKIAVGGMGAVVSAWDVGSGAEVFAMQPDKEVYRFDSRSAFSHDGKLMAIYRSDRFTRGQGNELILWDIGAKKELRRVNIAAANTGAANSAAGVAFSMDGKLIAVADSQGAILLISSATGREVRKLTSAAHNSLPVFAFSPDGRFLATGSSPRFFRIGNPGDDAILEIWEVASGLKRDQFKGHFAGITSLAYAPDGATVATGSADTTILLWDVLGKNTKVAAFAEDELPAAWKSLVSDDANLSLTMRRLIASPGAVAFLKQHFQPTRQVALDDKKVAKLVADLDSGNFKARAIAMEELKRLGEHAEGALKKGLDASPSVEARRRIQDLLDALIRTQLTPEELRAARAVEILERIGSPEARALIAAHAKGDPFAHSTQQAAAVLRREVRK